MKIFLQLLCTIICINSFGQTKPPKIWSVDDFIKIGYTKGISKLESLNFDFINLVYIDSTLAKKIVDIEFKSTFYEKHSDSVGIYWYNRPKNTEEIASKFNDKYAAAKLFSYYKSLPKFIKSDTIYGVYNNLDSFLSILLYYNPKGLKEKLKKDFYEWQKISKKAPIKKYLNQKEMRAMNFMESLKLKKSDLYPDCNYLVFQLANAIKLLHEPGFDNRLIAQLKKKQTYPYIDAYQFPISKNHEFVNFQNNVIKIKLGKRYPNIATLVKDSKGFEKILLQGIENCCAVRVYQIIYDKNNKAYVETSRNNGSDGYRICLTGNYLTIEELWQIME
jgi:hypothetical protein